MTKKQDDTMPTTFTPKYARILKELPEFKDTADSASPEELKKMIITAEGNIFNIEKEEENDEKLAATKLLMKELKEPYRDSIKVQNCKVRYCLFLLDGAGQELGDKED